MKTRNSNGTFKRGNPPETHTMFKHGDTVGGERTKEYRAWKHALGRCYCKTDAKYHRYGGRGIVVCKKWRESYQAFLSDVGRAKAQQLSLGRIDNNGNYEPGNVRWETAEQQSNNRRNNFFVTWRKRSQTLAQWARELSINYETLRRRLFYLGWPVHRSLSTPTATKFSTS